MIIAGCPDIATPSVSPLRDPTRGEGHGSAIAQTLTNPFKIIPQRYRSCALF
jgi:hypothetical protein